MKYKILKIAFFVWIALWLSFTVREIFIKGNINDWKALLPLSLEGKRAHVTGERLYEFISFCIQSLPGGATYKVMGLEYGSIEQRRAAYYLYPLLEKDDAEYLLVFDSMPTSVEDYDKFKELDSRRYILKRI